MFTGIVEEIGTIKEIIRSSRAIRLSITCSRIMDDVNIGDSIAVNGICLTVNYASVIGRFFVLLVLIITTLT